MKQEKERLREFFGGRSPVEPEHRDRTNPRPRPRRSGLPVPRKVSPGAGRIPPAPTKAAKGSNSALVVVLVFAVAFVGLLLVLLARQSAHIAELQATATRFAREGEAGRQAAQAASDAHEKETRRLTEELLQLRPRLAKLEQLRPRLTELQAAGNAAANEIRQFRVRNDLQSAQLAELQADLKRAQVAAAKHAATIDDLQKNLLAAESSIHGLENAKQALLAAESRERYDQERERAEKKLRAEELQRRADSDFLEGLRDREVHTLAEFDAKIQAITAYLASPNPGYTSQAKNLLADMRAARRAVADPAANFPQVKRNLLYQSTGSK